MEMRGGRAVEGVQGEGVCGSGKQRGQRRLWV